MKVYPIVQRLQQLRSDKIFNYVFGDYKGYKTAAKEFAKLSVENPESFKILQQTPAPKITVPMFSKPGLKMLKVWFLDKFRVKTPEEKALKKMCQRDYFEKQIIKSR